MTPERELLLERAKQLLARFTGLGEISHEARCEIVRKINVEIDTTFSSLRGRVEQAEKALAMSYPATPVDCLISELRDEFELGGGLTWERFQERLRQFKEEIGPVEGGDLRPQAVTGDERGPVSESNPASAVDGANPLAARAVVSAAPEEQEKA